MAHFTSYKLLAVAWWVLLLGLVTGCVSPYLPAVPAASQDNLVVNGFINSQGITTIQLTRSLALQATEAPRAETKATVAVVAANGQRFALAEGAAGTYASASQRLSPTMTYKLTIATAGGKTYETDLLPVKVAPAIDQVHWRYEKEGVQLYVDTHDASRNTIYYRWTFQETWQFTSAFESKLRYNPTTKLVEPRRDDIYHCWRTVNSTTVLQNSTARLSQDAVLDFPLIFIPATSEKLPTRYSILVQQFAQTKEEYDYWETLKKTTGSSGTLNDPLPTQLTGNIRCVSDPSEPVLGYVGVHAVSEQRLFIDRSELPMPFGFVFTTGNESCLLIAENRCPTRRAIPPPPPRVTFVFNNPQYLITNADCDTLCYPTACHYYGAAAACVDCRLRGTNVKPSFWK